METFSVKDIITFLGEEFNLERIDEETDLYADLELSGDDLFELIADFSETFKVDVSTYLWYFHSEEEGFNPGALFFDPPNKRVKRIKITPRLLAQFANAGKWGVVYPEHRLPGRRWDLVINRALALFALTAMCILALMKCD